MPSVAVTFLLPLLLLFSFVRFAFENIAPLFWKQGEEEKFVPKKAKKKRPSWAGQQQLSHFSQSTLFFTHFYTPPLKKWPLSGQNVPLTMLYDMYECQSPSSPLLIFAADWSICFSRLSSTSALVLGSSLYSLFCSDFYALAHIYIVHTDTHGHTHTHTRAHTKINGLRRANISNPEQNPGQ